MAMVAHIVGIRSSQIWLRVNLLGLFHPGPSPCKAASRLSMRWLMQEAEWLEQRKVT